MQNGRLFFNNFVDLLFQNFMRNFTGNFFEEKKCISRKRSLLSRMSEVQIMLVITNNKRQRFDNVKNPMSISRILSTFFNSTIHCTSITMVAFFCIETTGECI